MMPDEVGRTVLVETNQINIELHKEYISQYATTYDGVIGIGIIGTLLKVPVFHTEIVVMVTRVIVDTDDGDKQSQIVYLETVPIGRLYESEFKKGIESLPTVNESVYPLTDSDRDIIYAKEPGQILIGELVNNNSIKINAEIDSLFGRHTAILGNTGSGKSSTIARILQSIGEVEPEQSNILLIDSSGEYSECLKETEGVASSTQTVNAHDSSVDGLHLPYWFLTFEETSYLFKVAEGVQQPILEKAISRAMLREEESTKKYVIRLFLRHLHNMEMYYPQEHRSANRTYHQLERLHKHIDSVAQEEDLEAETQEILKIIRSYIEQVRENIASYELIEDTADDDWHDLGADEQIFLEDKIKDTRSQVKEYVSGVSPYEIFDVPRFYSFPDLLNTYLPSVLRQEAEQNRDVRQYVTTLETRLRKIRNDKKYDFLFPSETEEYQDMSIVDYVQDLLGFDESTNVSVIDVSQLPKKALMLFVAVISRILHEFSRLSDAVTRGSEEQAPFPITVIIDESQNYIPASPDSGMETYSYSVFNEIAREGRKFGLSLLLASQRPYELSKTALSQCSTFIVHRLMNPSDIDYIKSVSPDIYSELLSQLTLFEPRMSFVFGDAFPIASLMRTEEAKPPPDSPDPEVAAYWSTEDPDEPNWEQVLNKWTNID